MTPGHGLTPKANGELANAKNHPVGFEAKKISDNQWELKLTSRISSFKGFFIQGRNSNEEPIGKFITEDNFDVLVLPCGEIGTQNAISHGNAEPKEEISVIFEAENPQELSHFQYSFVISYDDYYVNLKYVLS